jgi:hypothetical protein
MEILRVGKMKILMNLFIYFHSNTTFNIYFDGTTTCNIYFVDD